MSKCCFLQRPFLITVLFPITVILAVIGDNGVGNSAVSYNGDSYNGQKRDRYRGFDLYNVTVIGGPTVLS